MIPAAFIKTLVFSGAIASQIGCAHLTTERQTELLEQQAHRYGQALRWGYYDVVMKYHAPPHHTPDFSVNLRNIRITAYEIVQPLTMTTPTMAVQQVRIEYVHSDQQRLHTLIDQQQWRYDAAKKTWWRDSPLPTFN